MRAFPLTMSPRPMFLWPIFLAALGCQAPRATEPGAPPPAFDFLVDRYDTGGDGRVSPAEYGRDARTFRRLDRSGDGLLGPSDFRLAGRRMQGLAPAQARMERARHLLAWYFQSDDRPYVLGKDELLGVHRAYDVDGNGWVGRREFEAAASVHAESGRRPAGSLAGLLEAETTDPWERILEGVDRTDDGFLDAAELAQFYVDAGAAAGFHFDPSQGMPVALRLEGAVAPDFTLSTLADAEQTVTLSDHAGATAVALIFGSYT